MSTSREHDYSDDAVWAVVITVLAAPGIAIVHPSWTALFVFGVLVFALIQAGHLLARVCDRHLDRPRPLSAKSQARVEAEIQRFHERHGLD